MMRHIIAAAVIAASALFAPLGWAHALLDHASPAPGSRSPVAPPLLRLWFTERLEPAFSTARVIGPSGASVTDGSPAVDPKDPTLLDVPLQKLPPGTYTVKWSVVSADTHHREGAFAFAVRP